MQRGLASLFGNTLATDIHEAITADELDPLANHHLQQLVGQAVAVLIECYETEQRPPNFLERILPIFRKRDDELSALAKTARTNWVGRKSTEESRRLEDSEIHRAFIEIDRTDPRPLVSAEEWDRQLAFLDIYLGANERTSLAQYIAPLFAAVVRELVKADLDPTIGSGGRIFIALHLDLMRNMAISIRSIDGRTSQSLAEIRSVHSLLADLGLEVEKKLNTYQATEFAALLLALTEELRTAWREISRQLADVKRDVGHVDVKLSIVAQRQADQATKADIAALREEIQHLQTARLGPPAKDLLDRFEERFNVDHVSAEEIDDLRVFAVKHMGQTIAPTETLRSWISVNDKIFCRLTNQVRIDAETQVKTLIGYFSLRPINKTAVRLIERCELDGAGLRPEHILPPRRKPSAIYIGGVAAASQTARGAIILYLKIKVNDYRDMGVKQIYTKPITEDGNQLALSYGFRPIILKGGKTKGVYRLTLF